MPKKQEKQKIIIYSTKSGPKLKVSLEKDTVWLTQKQIAMLFDVQRPAITKHIKNIFTSGELQEKAVCSILEHTAEDNKVYKTRYYNLDMIIAVGYRVNSIRATHFRIWATKTLKKYIIDGILVNQKRLLDYRKEKLTELEGAVKLLQQTIQKRTLKSDESEALLRLITDYTSSWVLLQKYDTQKLDMCLVSTRKGRRFTYMQAREVIDELKIDLMQQKEATELFGNEHSGGLQSIVGNIFQTFAGKALYPSIEEKAAHLLYFVIKNHPFSDGNKRIGSFLFIWFLMKNNYLFNQKGEKKINENALVAVALLVAESDPKQKDLMVKLVVNLINNR